MKYIYVNTARPVYVKKGATFLFTIYNHVFLIDFNRSYAARAYLTIFPT